MKDDKQKALLVLKGELERYLYATISEPGELLQYRVFIEYGAVSVINDLTKFETQFFSESSVDIMQFKIKQLREDVKLELLINSEKYEEQQGFYAPVYSDELKYVYDGKLLATIPIKVKISEAGEKYLAENIEDSDFDIDQDLGQKYNTYPIITYEAYRLYYQGEKMPKQVEARVKFFVPEIAQLVNYDKQYEFGQFFVEGDFHTKYDTLAELIAAQKNNAN